MGCARALMLEIEQTHALDEHKGLPGAAAN